MQAQLETFDVGEWFISAPLGEPETADREAPGQDVDVHAIDAGATAGHRLHPGDRHGTEKLGQNQRRRGHRRGQDAQGERQPVSPLH